MDLFEIKNMLGKASEKVSRLKEYLSIERGRKRMAEIRESMTLEEVWSDQAKTRELGKELRLLEDNEGKYVSLVEDLDEISVMTELLEEEADDEILSELEEKVKGFDKLLKESELRSLLNEPNDSNDAYVEIHPGAGGTESQDWTSMLMRMYEHWSRNHKYTVEIVDYQDGDEAGVKAVTLKIKGNYAFGYLKAENGVHRLVRISPFDSNKRRHTSFSSVFVYPEIEEDIEVEINEKDLRVDTFRASGAGGQHVNMTDSAVRITHIPTNVVVQCQNERSQIQNREQAMKMLRARLYQLELEKLEAERTKLEDSKMENSWGSQIRSYVLHPYKMIKDHRTNIETSNTDAVLNGDIDQFIFGYLDFRQTRGN